MPLQVPQHARLALRAVLPALRAMSLQVVSDLNLESGRGHPLSALQITSSRIEPRFPSDGVSSSLSMGGVSFLAASDRGYP